MLHRRRSRTPYLPWITTTAHSTTPRSSSTRRTWEHAHYLQYKNVKADYVKTFWNVVNWADVQGRFAAATSKTSGLIFQRIRAGRARRTRTASKGHGSVASGLPVQCVECDV
ncbi:MAG: superoxide dismutase, Fe-Mn family [Mycobacterium sp.]|nr:superoxide dismutase, Fe-Mn family [Mycobacterium sp.]